MKIVLIAVSGMLGALARYFLAGWVSSLNGTVFPYGTLVVNVVGSFLIGFSAVLLFDKLAVDPLWRVSIMIGFLGSFTTFATFELETLNLIQEGLGWLAFANVFGSVALGLGAAWLGFITARMI
ncbi:MAG: fluoride efflux transporter CrcB [Peptococcaceae bacterium]|nr:fluoride efflux transporter CrcB [Peptococcaceae bacterium]